jgi:hypothetical protein
LLGREEQGGLLPSNVTESLIEFEELIVWKVIQGTDKKVEVPEPQTGVDEAFDTANENINNIKAELNDYLKQVQKQFKEFRRIQYSHAKQRYEIEIPEEYVRGNQKPKEYEFVSQR